MSDAEFELLINDIFDYSKYSGKNWKYLQANCMVAATVLQHMSTKVIGTKHDRKYLSFITACINSDKVSWTCLRLSYTLQICLIIFIKTIFHLVNSLDVSNYIF